MEACSGSIGNGVRGHVVVFPAWRRAGDIRAVAARLAAIGCPDAADEQRYAIAAAMFDELAALGLGEDEQDEAVGAFFHEVDCLIEDLREPDLPQPRPVLRLV